MTAIVDAHVPPDKARLRELALARIEADEAYLDQHVSVYAKAIAARA